MIVIKRYPNRKLYDTRTRRYVSLEHVAALIRAGQEVQVVEQATSNDVTALVLMQIIVEQERASNGFLPPPVVAGLVRAGGHTLAALRRGLTDPLDLMRQVDEVIERRIARLVMLHELTDDEGRRLTLRLLEMDSPATSQDEPGHGVGIPGMPTRADVQLHPRSADFSPHGMPTRADVQRLSGLLAESPAAGDELAAKVEALGN